MISRDSNKSTKSIPSAIVFMLGAILVFGAPDMSEAQTSQNTSFDQQNPMSWGLRAGVSTGDLLGDDVSGSDMRAGFTGGVYMNYRMHPNFSIQPELLYTNKNSEVASAVGPTEVVTEYDLAYLEIPVLAKGHLPIGGTWDPYLYAGPNLAFNLSAEANDTEIDDNVNGTDFGLSFGGGVNVYQNINLDIRYTLGMADTFDMTGDPDAKNAVWNFTLGYSL